MADRIRRDAWRPGRNWIRSGDPVRVAGLRGLFTFDAYVTAAGREWVECYELDAKGGRGAFHAVRPERVRRVAVTRRGRRRFPTSTTA